MSITIAGGFTASGGGWTLQPAPPPTGQQEFTTPGTTSFVVPTGVTTISAVCVGAGYAYVNSRSGGGGGGLPPGFTGGPAATGSEAAPEGLPAEVAPVEGAPAAEATPEAAPPTQ